MVNAIAWSMRFAFPKPLVNIPDRGGSPSPNVWSMLLSCGLVFPKRMVDIADRRVSHLSAFFRSLLSLHCHYLAWRSLILPISRSRLGLSCPPGLR